MEITSFLRLFSRVITLLLVLPIHEAAHGLVAKWCGDDTAEREGRLTLNPFAHLDPLGSILIVLSGFGWAKPVPVNPMRMKKYRAGFALTALAGPVSNLLAAFVSILVWALLLCTESGMTAYLSGEITPMYSVLLLLQFLFSVNVGLALFNLIPFPPLDGFNVLRYFTNEKFDRWFYMHQQQLQWGFLIVILVLNYIPSQYNILAIANNFVSDKMLNLVWQIPMHKWGMA
ncbi:MAG: site-2 protease family protein [Ruminococcus sp.]|nr:site-2 protease family protein [Ruminococcus sp.]